MNFRECYTPHPLGVNGSISLDCTQLGAFICTTDGTISVTDASGLALLASQPVTAGQYLPLVFSTVSRTSAANQTVVTLASGASGLLLV